MCIRDRLTRGYKFGMGIYKAVDFSQLILFKNLMTKDINTKIFLNWEKCGSYKNILKADLDLNVKRRFLILEF